MNLYHTDGIKDSDYASQHNCLVVPLMENNMYQRQTMSFCMSELPSKFNIEKDNFFSNFTFHELSKQNITSQQLYIWSTPIDIIENYQFYLNQLSTSNDLSLANEVYYNCTIPRFGSMCQYEFLFHYSHDLSLYDIVQRFYYTYEYNPTTFTCYIHLKCNRGPLPSCLDWTEICDGKIDCLGSGFDEEHCWQLEINVCKDNEYRCRNGQCIPQSFYDDGGKFSDCIDSSDVRSSFEPLTTFCRLHQEPSFSCEDRVCKNNPWTSSCVFNRANLLLEAMYSGNESFESENCLSAFKCLVGITNSKYLSCDKYCKRDECIQIIQNNCSNMLYFPSFPVLFDNIYFAYEKNDLQYWIDFTIPPFYICYDTSQYDDFFVNYAKILFNNMTCVHSKLFLPRRILSSYPISNLYQKTINELYELLKRYHLSFNYTSAICNRSNMYQCARSSKCISIYRLVDIEYDDCPYMDDENITAITTTDRIQHFNRTHFKCEAFKKYIHQSFVSNGKCDCGYTEGTWCEDEDLHISYLKSNILFQHICDGFVDLSPLSIAGRNETDETECKQWQCNNIYTRCNDVWNCPNGVDESGCVSSSILNCSSKHHLCILPNTNQFTCLPIEKTNDGNIDCLGATDEPTLCGTKIQSISTMVLLGRDFYCKNQSIEPCIFSAQLCDGHNDCDFGDDERFCTTNRTSKDDSICSWNNYYISSNVEKFLCNYHPPTRMWKIIYFQIDKMIESIEHQVKNIENTMLSSTSIIQMTDQHQPRCHRGLDLRVWLNNKNNLTTNTCMCPPSFYGSQCQYQNQRISLTIKFRALASSWQTLFAIVILLIDDSDQRIIHSYEQFTHLSVRDCESKFNSYLLYSTRPKDSTKNYTIHIDFYENEKVPLTYRGSVLFPIMFPFLPVHRLAFIVDIPRSNDKTQKCSNKQCVHGKCIKYSNNSENITFCQCDQGWSGQYCTFQHTCKCSSDSLCIGVSANNRSICICPINKRGPRCLLIDTICQTNNNSTCQNGGQCISNVDYVVFDQNFACICPKGFTGNRCEIADKQLILSFEKHIVLSQSIFIHFIEVLNDSDPVRTTTFKTISIQQDSIIIYWSRSFHLVFTELFKKIYYLTVVQNTYNQSEKIIKMINPSDRCPNISELFNESFNQLHLLRRIKYYHLPCQNQSLNLSCFHDDAHFCLCYEFRQQRMANCFKFNHNMRMDCLGQNECENDGECLQDKLVCPTKSLCICPQCFYGSRCQFTTSGFGLSLDGIIGYHILPIVSLTHQPFVVQFSLGLTIIFMVVGFINSILSMITFKNKAVREVGCGIYLLASSITTLLTMTIFTFKFLILLLAQMTIISNRSFLQVQCHSIDFLLRVCLNMDQWLNACVSTERAITAIKGASFVKRKSKKAAKLVIITLLIVVIGTFIHDPIYRRLIDEENEADDAKRTWCIVSYSSNLQIYNSVINSFHFFGPFTINLVSAIILIIKKSRQQANMQKQRPYKKILREQFRLHKHLLTAPIALVILGLPRFIITLVSKCMKSANDLWLFLVGYFISFIPAMITFFIFIIPSKFYTAEFHKSIAHYRTNIQRRLNITQ